MNKKLLVLFIVILLIGLGGIVYQKLSYEAPTASEVADNQQSLHDLLLTPNTTCTFQVNNIKTGTLYAAESNFRIDFAESGLNTHIISDFSNVFLWFAEKDTGISPLSLRVLT